MAVLKLQERRTVSVVSPREEAERTREILTGIIIHSVPLDITESRILFKKKKKSPNETNLTTKQCLPLKSGKIKNFFQNT